MFIYVCTPEDKTKNPAQTKFACYLIAKHGHVPIAPRLYFPQFIQTNAGPLSEELLSICDEVWAIGSTTDSMKAEVEQATREHIPVKHFINMGVMASMLENPDAEEEETQSPRSFDELMGELVRVNDDEDSREIFEFACAKARALEPRTHMDRGIVEKLLLLYNSMLHDMEKVEMTEEEKEILLRKGLDQIAELLNIDTRLAAAVLLMSKEETDDYTIVEVITEYCAKHAPEIARITGFPQSLVDKIVFISNIWRWRDRKQIMEGNYNTWWPKHVAELAELLGESENLIRKILDAELTGK